MIHKGRVALAMYEAGLSMLQIQKRLGHVTVKNIRAWGIAETKEVAMPKKEKKPKKKKFKVQHKNKRGKKHKARSAKRSWKERVFAGWADTPEQAAFRRSPEYQQWRVIVLERDKYTCQHCEATGGRLVVHHVETFKMNPEKRLDPDNGIVLCNKCHEELHLSRVRKPKKLRLVS